jgi:hypothetical protein
MRLVPAGVPALPAGRGPRGVRLARAALVAALARGGVALGLAATGTRLLTAARLLVHGRPSAALSLALADAASALRFCLSVYLLLSPRGIASSPLSSPEASTTAGPLAGSRRSSVSLSNAADCTAGTRCRVTEFSWPAQRKSFMPLDARLKMQDPRRQNPAPPFPRPAAADARPGLAHDAQAGMAKRAITARASWRGARRS